MASRLDAVKASFDKVLQKKFAGPALDDLGLAPAELMCEVIRHESRAGTIRPGGVTKVIHQLTPDELGTVQAAATIYSHERELGRWGDTERVLKHFGADRELAEAVTDGLEVDYVTKGLMDRRGTDAGLPLPELTRRDVLAAAIDAHVE